MVQAADGARRQQAELIAELPEQGLDTYWWGSGLQLEWTAQRQQHQPARAILRNLPVAA